jgi:hypothetical protein
MLRPPVEPPVISMVVKALCSRAKKGLFNALALLLEKSMHGRNLRNGHASPNHNNRPAVAVPQRGEIMWHSKVQGLGPHSVVSISSLLPNSISASGHADKCRVGLGHYFLECAVGCGFARHEYLTGLINGQEL